jgi:hypothetical protein
VRALDTVRVVGREKACPIHEVQCRRKVGLFGVHIYKMISFCLHLFCFTSLFSSLVLFVLIGLVFLQDASVLQLELERLSFVMMEQYTAGALLECSASLARMNEIKPDDKAILNKIASVNQLLQDGL